MITTLYARAGERAGKVGSEAELARHHQEAKGILWVDLDNPTESEVRVLSTVFRFHTLAIEDCLEESSHPRIDDYGEYVYLVMHGATATAQRGSFQTQELDVFCGKGFLVTHHKVPIRALEDVRKRCLEVEGHMARGADFLMHDVLDDLAGSFLKTLVTLDTEVDELENRLFKKATKAALAEIFAVKKDILQIKRVVSPQREVLNRLARGEFRIVGKEAQLYFRDVYDTAYHVAELTESFRDVVTSALETYLAVISNRTNEVVKVLTICSIILMTLSLLAGIYGMNIWLPMGGWKGAFPVLLGVMGGIAAVLYFLFRRRKWI